LIGRAYLRDSRRDDDSLEWQFEATAVTIRWW
jgi:hypothetical protein